MSSADIKENLTGWFSGTKEKDWKRTSKKNLGGEEVRYFHNAAIGVDVITMDDGDSYCEIGPLVFGIMAIDEDDWNGDESEVCVAFATPRFWKANRHIPDDHMLWVLENHYGVPPGLLDEACENQFFLYNVDIEAAKQQLIDLGFQHEPEISQLLTSVL